MILLIDMIDAVSRSVEQAMSLPSAHPIMFTTGKHGELRLGTRSLRDDSILVDR